MGILSLVQLGALVQIATAAPFNIGDLFNILSHERGNQGHSGKASHAGSSSRGGQSAHSSVVSIASSSSFASTASSTIASSTVIASTIATAASTASSDVVIDGTCANTASTRQCWGNGYWIGTDAETSWPNTGVTKSYTLEITNITMAPDGTQRQVFAINGQYPGPTIEADWGDTVSITVKNSLQYNGTSIHWHGVQQKDTNNMDGVNGVTECPLAPGDSKTYTWLATQYGTSWYHSHYASQYGDGVLGPIVINGPATANYDIDLGPYPLTDWYYTSATDVGIANMKEGIPWKADTGLINGTMVNSNGGGAYARTSMQSGKTYRLRLINTSVDNNFKVHLDGHNMTIIQADFVSIEPLEVDWLFIAIGQRYDVLITASETVDNYWFRAEPQTACGDNWSAGSILSIFSYEGADTSANPTTTGTSYTAGCVDQTGLVPWWKKDVPQDLFAAQSQSLDVLMSVGSDASWANGASVVQWSLNGEMMSVDWAKPTLDYVFNSETSNFSATQNIIELPNADEWTFWIIQSLAGDITSAPHPIHLHGHDFYVLGAGEGAYTEDLAQTLTYSMPTRRDVAMLAAVGWLVIAFQTDNPGSWLMHCHIAWHVGEGLSLQFLERASDIPDTFQLDGEYERTCANWDAYYSSAPYQKSDSGL